MKSILVVYSSKTGFTKKYVDWIEDSIECRVASLDRLGNIDINKYDIIVYGGGVQAGLIGGLKEFKKKVKFLSDKSIIVFATGGAPHSDSVLLNIKERNFVESEWTEVDLFYFESGLNYKDMGTISKLMMKMYSGILRVKRDKSNIEEGVSKAISKSYDNSDKKNIVPMISYLKQLANTN